MEHDIGKTIASLRKEKGWTQAELAQKLNVGDKAVSKWEAGGGFPSLEFIPALAKVFGVTTDYLLTGVKEEPQKTYSDLELCVKNGNIPRALKLYGERDENGKSVLDYAIEYKNIDMVTMMLSPDGYLLCSRQNNGKRSAVDIDDIIYEKCTRFLKELLGEYSLAEYYKAVLRLLPLNLEREISQMAYHYMNGNRSYNSYSYNSNNRCTGYNFKEELRDNIEFHRNEDEKQTAAAKEEFIKVCEYLIVHYEELENEQCNYYFGITNAQTKEFNCWRRAYPYFIALAYKHGKTELFKKLVSKYGDKVYNARYEFDITPLLQVIIQAYESDKASFNLVYRLFEEKKGTWENEKKLLNFILTVYKKHGKEEGDKLNKIVHNHYSEDEIRCLLIDNDKEKTKAQKLEEKCVYMGILWLDKALESGSDAFIKKVIKKYPLTLAELFEEDLKNRNYGNLFKFVMDNVGENPVEVKEYDTFAREVLNAACFADAAKIPEVIEEYGQKSIERQLAYNDINVFNAIPLYCEDSNDVLNKLLKANAERLTDYNYLASFKGKYSDLEEYLKQGMRNDIRFEQTFKNERSKFKPNFKYNVNSNNVKSIDFLYTFVEHELNEYRNYVIHKIEDKNKPKKQNTAAGKTDKLTKEYFKELLKAGDSEKVVIKLCVKLEDYFKTALGLEGTLFEMLESYCAKIGQNSERARILHRLRMARNSEAHPEETVTLSSEELEKCVKTVFEIVEGK